MVNEILCCCFQKKGVLINLFEQNKDFKGAIDLRDIKRRPKSYRTGQSSTYMEKIRELIDFQMGLMKECAEREAKVGQKSEKKTKKKKKKRSKHESNDDEEDEGMSHKKKSKKRRSSRQESLEMV